MPYALKHSSTPLARILATSLLCASLSGCMVGPNYHTPAAPTPPAFKEPAPASPIAVPAGAAWWKVFNDATLDDLEKQAIDANPDVQIAVAHVDQADAVRRSVHSAQLPTVAAGSSASRNREAQQRPNNGNTSGRAATYNDFQAFLSLSYEVDAWGRIRRMVQSATASQQATEADLRFVRLSVAASVATDYYMLREADVDINILQTPIFDLH